MDAMAIDVLPAHMVDQVVGFLASKRMDMLYLDGLSPRYSPSRQRLLLYTEDGVMGRDLTDRSPQKWLTYNGQHYLSSAVNTSSFAALLVEDAFSWAKVAYTITTFALPVAVYCTLGTRIHDSLFLECIRKHTHIVTFYDGDAAGYAGQASNDRRVRAMNLKTSRFDNSCAPHGLDPKDMTLAQIKRHIEDQFLSPSLFTI
jgi:hypothetical protein